MRRRHHDDATVRLVQDYDNILYISCNPVTLATDLSQLSEQYTVSDVIGIDILELSTLGGGLHCLTSHVCPATIDRHQEPIKSRYLEPLAMSASGMRRA